MTSVKNSSAAQQMYIAAVVYNVSNRELSAKTIAANIHKNDPNEIKNEESIRKDICDIAANITDGVISAIPVTKNTFPLWNVRNVDNQWLITIKPSIGRTSLHDLVSVMNGIMTPGIKYDVDSITDSLAKRFIRRYSTIREYMTTVLLEDAWQKVYTFTNENGRYMVSRKAMFGESQPTLNLSTEQLVQPPKEDVVDMSINIKKLYSQLDDFVKQAQAMMSLMKATHNM